MKLKNDAAPDEWVRHMLNQLPDAPPPGSSFDSARLWNQLRPELPTKPARQWARWWLAAACLAGLLISWLTWPKQPGEPKMAASQHQPNTPLSAKSTAEINETAPVIVRTYQPERQRSAMQNQPKHRPANVVSAPRSAEPEQIAQLTEQSISPVTSAVIEIMPETRQANVTATTSKRRFRVMHDNELRAEDEAAPQLYRTDHFVRLGNGQRSDPVTANRQSGLIMPLRIN